MDDAEQPEAPDDQADESAPETGAEEPAVDASDSDSRDSTNEERPSHSEGPAGFGRSAIAVAVAVAALAGVAGLGLHRARPPARCVDGLQEMGARCCGEGQTLSGDRCQGPPQRCAGGMTKTEIGCIATSRPIAIAAGRLRITPHDWEAAEKGIRPYEADVAAFAIDSHEVIEQQWDACAAKRVCASVEITGEPGRSMVGVSAVEAATYCKWVGGRLPTKDEWAFAAAGVDARRYPWGETGAVCRRAAFGLLSGPCANGGSGPELAGAHPEGATPSGVHDLAGNVAEWTAPLTEGKHAGKSVVRGGSWRDGEAADLRTWNERLLGKDKRSDSIGLRCVYDAAGTNPAVQR
jgi:Sulfatase-modifying factor enzyme 1